MTVAVAVERNMTCSIFVKVLSSGIGLINENAMVTKAVCNMDNVYQYFVLTHYMYTKYISTCRLRYELGDSNGDSKTQILGS